MKKLTRTMLGTLFLAGSATGVLAAGMSPDTSSSPMTAPSGTSWNNPDNAGTGGTVQPGGAQNQTATMPTTTTDTGSRDLTARTSPSTAGTGNAGMSTTAQSSMRQPAAPHGGKTAYRAATAEGDRMTEALNLLGSDGYVNIQSLTPQGEQFVANATLNGRNVSVIVDPQTHQVTNRS